MYLPKHGKWPSQHLYLKINSGFHARKNPKQQYLKVVAFSDPLFPKKHIYVYDHAAQITHWTDHHSVHDIRQKLGLFVLGVTHSHIKSSHSLDQIDVNGWVGLALWCLDLTHEIWIFVKILKNNKLASIKANLKTLLILPKTKNLNWLHHVTLKI